jgi:hypothetical protein
MAAPLETPQGAIPAQCSINMRTVEFESDATISRLPSAQDSHIFLVDYLANSRLRRRPLHHRPFLT